MPTKWKGKAGCITAVVITYNSGKQKSSAHFDCWATTARQVLLLTLSHQILMVFWDSCCSSPFHSWGNWSSDCCVPRAAQRLRGRARIKIFSLSAWFQSLPRLCTTLPFAGLVWQGIHMAIISEAPLALCFWHFRTSGVSNLWPVGHMQPRMAVNAAQHKIINLLKTLWVFFCDCALQCI